MKIIRFSSHGKVYAGIPALAAQDSREIRTAFAVDGDPLGQFEVTSRELQVDSLLAPLIPTDILCIALNYRRHAAESGSEIPRVPVLFIKSSNSLNHPFAPIPLPRLSSQVDYEGELAVVIGRDAREVPREKALDHVFGYTVGNDVSARDWQRDKALGGGQFTRGKSFDGFCPLGPWIVTKDEVPDPGALHLRTSLDGQVVQDSSTSDMIFDVPALIESLSSTMTLRKGSVILTGTPEGVGFARKPPLWLKAGDTVEIEIERIGRLTNPVQRGF